MTTSSSGMYGNFGQANYGAAKMGVIGLMNALTTEGRKNNIKVNTIAPVAATRMTADILPEAMLQRIQPERVTPAVLFLASDDAPSKTIIAAGGGAFAAATVVETAPVLLADQDVTPEGVAAHFGAIANWSSARPYDESGHQVQGFLKLVCGQ
jgi:hypothetical protein